MNESSETQILVGYNLFICTEKGPSTKLSLSGMVSLLLEQLSKERAKGQARALFDLWTDTLNLKNYGQLIEKAFRTEIDSSEIKRYKKIFPGTTSINQERGEPQDQF